MAITVNRSFETHKRSAFKAISWRFFSFWIIIAITYFLTNETVIAVSVGVIDFFVKIVTFYFHERIWNRIHYGRVAEQYKEGEGI